MEVIIKQIEYSRPDKLYFYDLSDLHLGAVHCDEKSLIEKVYEIKQYGRQAIVLGGGDYGDCITPNDLKRWDARILAPWLLDDMNEKLPPWMRSNMDNIGPGILRRVDEILSPIWGSFVGLIEGNHDDGIRKHNHYNFMKELLILANKKHKVEYAGVQCFLVLHFVRKNSNEVHDIIIHARHGEGAARTSGARALAVLRMAQSTPEADVTLMSHLHGQESPDIPQRLVVRKGKLKERNSLAAMTGAWLLAYKQGVPPSYLERYGSPPSVLGCPRIIFNPDKHIMTLEKTRNT
uniref:Calcineurin-like phosphoesterase domain-containing protein n=1 Tax=viral metagenome TaxID=1070528 RepID=A0A6M3KSM8_9ZZZZ